MCIRDRSQGVLFPEIVQLPASEAAVLESIMEDFSAVGFELTPLGGGSYAINGIPSCLLYTSYSPEATQG